MTMQFLRQAALVLQRDITIELRQKSLLVSMIVFSILIQVVLFISFDVQKEAMQTLAAGILWLPIILSAMISFSKYAKAEKENGAMHGMLVSPINRGAMFLGKLMGNLIFVSMVGVVSVPAFFLFLKQPPLLPQHFYCSPFFWVAGALRLSAFFSPTWLKQAV
ncbi:heme exporter protein CcmB [Novibacillus thermophilus]|uniref:Uncharacterized protein n=1 Tax=Novibacillus thermophilus TaxID=1471761 RepID=A0A1U9K6U9_9BACL|nr:heme exporter protein CcmB [Novibacillus thermophilus]AQS55736.1 hypothetical protein B0W44_07950 [Novibacillus thermophilus]